MIIIGCTKSPTGASTVKISRDELHFYPDRAEIDLNNYNWIYFNDSETDSMYPTIKKNSHAIALEVEEETQINVGDIILFNIPGIAGSYAHRVIEQGFDKYGEYFITQGDNNQKKDDIKIRRDQVSYVIAAIIY